MNKIQRELLSSFGVGWRRACNLQTIQNTSGAGSYAVDKKIPTNTLMALCRKGYLEHDGKDYYFRRYKLTPAGRAVLEAEEEKCEKTK